MFLLISAVVKWAAWAELAQKC